MTPRNEIDSTITALSVGLRRSSPETGVQTTPRIRGGLLQLSLSKEWCVQASDFNDLVDGILQADSNMGFKYI